MSEIKRIQVDNDKGLLRLDWDDGQISNISMQTLRGHCPCALCQGHMKANRFIENQVSGISSAQWVGRYGIKFHFSDGHNTGLFRLNFLKSLVTDPVDVSC
jgi:DUF971 family protein